MVHARSGPCKIIGYAPHSRVWRLWHKDAAGHSRVFESVHVEFVESHNATDRLRPRGGLIPPVQGPVRDPFAADGHVGTHRPAQAPGRAPQSRIEDVSEEEEWLRDAEGEYRVVEEEQPAEEEMNDPSIPPPAPIEPPAQQPAPAPAPEQAARPRRHVQTAAERLKAAVEASAESAARLNAEKAERRAAREAAAQTIPDPVAPAAFMHRAYVCGYGVVSDEPELADMTPQAFEQLARALAASNGNTVELDASENDPASWKAAMAGPNREHWRGAGGKEATSLRDRDVYELVPRSAVPRGRRVMRGKMVLRLKRDQNGQPIRFKARYVVQGFMQVEGRDFNKTTSPTARLESQ